MGADGGTIPTRCELVTTKKKPEQKDVDADRIFRWQHCHLRQDALEPNRVVSCMMGGLYNKESVLQMLVDKTDKVKHIKGLKDICELDLTPNPGFDAKKATSNGYTDKLASPWICPITGLEMNGRFKFVFDWTTGRVLSERAYKMVKSDESARIMEENVIVINPDTDDDINTLRVKMDARKAREKAAKKAKKDAKKKDSEAFKAPMMMMGSSQEVGPPPAKKLKEDKSKTDDKSKIKSSSKNKDKPDVQNDPTKSEIYKSLFSSHKSAQNRPKGNWVTFDPRYN